MELSLDSLLEIDFAHSDVYLDLAFIMITHHALLRNHWLLMQHLLKNAQQYSLKTQNNFFYDPQIVTYFKICLIPIGSCEAYYFSLSDPFENMPIHLTEESENARLYTFEFFWGPKLKSTPHKTMPQL